MRDIVDYIQISMLMDALKGDSAPKIEETMDLALVAMSKDVMLHRLNKARGEGKSEWYNEKLVSDEKLTQLANRALQEKDFVSAMNYAAMLHFRNLAKNYAAGGEG